MRVTGAHVQALEHAIYYGGDTIPSHMRDSLRELLADLRARVQREGGGTRGGLMMTAEQFERFGRELLEKIDP